MHDKVLKRRESGILEFLKDYKWLKDYMWIRKSGESWAGGCGHAASQRAKLAECCGLERVR